MLFVQESTGSYRTANFDEVWDHARQVMNSTLHTGAKITSPNIVKNYLIAQFAGQPYESFYFIGVTAQHCIIECKELFRGSMTSTTIYSGEVVKEALKMNCVAAFIAHNHPSGEINPSDADQVMTERLKSALDLVDIRLLDHIVVAGSRTYSFAENYLIT